MRRTFDALRTAPLWTIAPGLAITVVAVSLALPETSSTGDVVVAVAGWVIGAVDFPRGVELVVFTVALAAVGHVLGRASAGDHTTREAVTRGS